MSILKYFKNTPRSPPIGRQALSIIFFLQIRNEVPGKKGPVASPRATGGPVAPSSGDRWAQPTGAAGGPVAPPPGRPGYSPYKSSSPPIPSSFESENSTKNPEKKRGVRRRKVAKPYRI